MDILRSNTPAVCGKAKAVCQGIGAHPGTFGTPSPALASILAQEAVVDQAEVLAGTRAKGTAKARNVQRGILVSMLEAELMYVQGIADQAATVEAAAAVIEAAAYTVALVSKYQKPLLQVKQGPTSGAVLIIAHARLLTGGSKRRCFFGWQYSPDGGKTWITLPSTPKASTTLTGLTALTVYSFRVNVTMSDAIPGEWSQVITFLVH
jgi:hypothetical protein